MPASRDRDRPDRGTSFRLPIFPTTREIEERLAHGITIAELARAYEHLRDRYEAAKRTPPNLSPAAVAAYAVARLPATFTATVAALTQVGGVIRDWQPRSLLDIGSGLGSSAWAALSAFPTLERLTLVEDSPAMTVAGRALAAGSGHRGLRDATWTTNTPTSSDGSDLVVASYVLGELDQPSAVVVDWWAACTGAIVVIEPGTPAGYERIIRVRAQLLALGATIAAPCPHDGRCPLEAGSWCHFGVTVARSRLHRIVKGATLGFEEEKFSYVAATSPAMTRVRRPRVIRKPSRRGGHVRVELCTDAEILERTVARHDPDYRRVRRLRWGDAMPPPTRPEEG